MAVFDDCFQSVLFCSESSQHSLINEGRKNSRIGGKG